MRPSLHGDIFVWNCNFLDAFAPSVYAKCQVQFRKWQVLKTASAVEYYENVAIL